MTLYYLPREGWVITSKQLNEKHPAATRTAWKILDRTLTKEDRIMVEGWKAELDNLLVYVSGTLGSDYEFMIS